MLWRAAAFVSWPIHLLLLLLVVLLAGEKEIVTVVAGVAVRTVSTLHWMSLTRRRCDGRSASTTISSQSRPTTTASSSQYRILTRRVSVRTHDLHKSNRRWQNVRMWCKDRKAVVKRFDGLRHDILQRVACNVSVFWIVVGSPSPRSCDSFLSC